MSNLTRRDPLDDLFRGFFVRPVDFGSGTNTEAPQMRVDVKENAEGYDVHAELPGLKKEDIHVHIYFGKVSRSFQLGQDVDEAKASAKFTDGVLELTLPKKLAAQAKRLSID